MPVKLRKLEDEKEWPRSWRSHLYHTHTYQPYVPKPKAAARPRSAKQQFADDLFETILANIASGDVTVVELEGLLFTPVRLIQAVQHRARTHKPPVTIFTRRVMLDGKRVELFFGQDAELHPPYPNT